MSFKFIRSIFTIAATLCLPLTLAAQNSEVQYDRPDSRSCWGTCLQTSTNYSIVATVAHCIADSFNGGVKINGNESIGVFVADHLRGSGDDLAEKDVENKDDFALLVFRKGACDKTIKRTIKGQTQSSNGDGTELPNVARVYRDGNPTEEVIESYSSDPEENIFLTTTNNSNFKEMDGVSGTGLYGVSRQEYLGPLIGCFQKSCRYYSVHQDRNPLVQKIFSEANQRGYYSLP